MKRLIGGKEPVQARVKRILERNPALEPAYDVEPWGRRASYHWTPEKVEMLEKLIAEGLSSKEIARRLNEKFPGGARAKSWTVSARLSTDVYKRRPELKRQRHGKHYSWTPEKVRRLEDLVAKGLIYEEIVKMLNKEFPEGIRADTRTARLPSGIAASFSTTSGLP